MPYCSRCGVEVGESLNKCPLCRAPIQKFYEEDGRLYPADQAPAPILPDIDRPDMRRMSLAIITFSMLIPLLITLSVDRVLNQQFTWSWFSTISLLAVWMWSSLPLIIRKNAILLYSLCFIIGGALLIGIDLKDNPGLSWSYAVGLPLLFLSILLLGTVISMTAGMKNPGLLISSMIVFSLALLSFAGDLTLSRHLTGSASSTWSLIVLSACLPISGLLFYLHIRFFRGSDINKVFHV